MDPNKRDDLFTWLVMENLQDSEPYLWFGWEGIVPIIYYAT